MMNLKLVLALFLKSWSKLNNGPTRAYSSVRLERIADNDEVPGSNPGTPTGNESFQTSFEFELIFDIILIQNTRIRSGT